jgi:hypothetical protein
VTRLPGLTALAVVAVLGVSGCAIVGGDDAGSGEAEAALEAQRTDVRAAAAEVGRALTARVRGDVVDSRGDWEGCESAFMDELRNFRYRATVRVSGGAGEPVRALEALLTDAGFEVDRVEADGIAASTPEVALTLLTVPAGGASGDWLVEVTGAECVDVPEDDRDDWLRREEPSPSIL